MQHWFLCSKDKVPLLCVKIFTNHDWASHLLNTALVKQFLVNPSPNMTTDFIAPFHIRMSVFAERVWYTAAKTLPWFCCRMLQPREIENYPHRILPMSTIISQKLSSKLFSGFYTTREILLEGKWTEETLFLSVAVIFCFCKSGQMPQENTMNPTLEKTVNSVAIKPTLSHVNYVVKPT